MDYEFGSGISITPDLASITFVANGRTDGVAFNYKETVSGLVPETTGEAVNAGRQRMDDAQSKWMEAHNLKPK